MSIEAFGSRRVTEALRAIGSYLDDGAKLAAGVDPASTIPSGAVTGQVVVSPRITEVIWTSTYSSTLELPIAAVDTFMDVFGSGLDNPSVFKLAVGGSEKLFASTVRITPVSSTRFTAAFKVSTLSPGSYDAAVTNKAGQTFVLARACVIKGPGQSMPGLQLGGVIPDYSSMAVGTGYHVTFAVLVVLSGHVDKVHVTDKFGALASGWTVDIVPESHCQWPSQAIADRVGLLPPGTNKVCLKITIPNAISTPELFCLVAESVTPISQDKLAFVVR